MYRLLIVDDEMDVVEYFHRIFLEKSCLPLEVYKAHSSREALEVMNRIRFDIILSDIKMPEMTGLQMYDVIKDRWPKCRVVFLSGVIEFEYVYKSIQNKDVRYLTKLEPTDKIIATVKEVIDEIDTSYEEENARELAQKQVEKARPLLQNRYLQNLLYGIIDSRDSIQKRFDELGICLEIDEPMILLGGIFDNLPDDLSPYFLEQNLYSLKRIAGEYLGRKYNFANYISEQNHLIWILQKKESADPGDSGIYDALNGLLEYIQEAGRKAMDLTMTFVYDMTPTDAGGVWEKYGIIKRRLGYRSKLLKNSILSLSDSRSDISPESSSPTGSEVNTGNPLLHIYKLEGFLELGHQKNFFSLLSQMVNSLESGSNFSSYGELEVYYRLVSMFLKYINEWNLTIVLEARMDLRRLTRAYEHSSRDEAVEYLVNLSKYIFEIHFNDEDLWSHNAISEVQKYIYENLEKDLSLIVLSDRVSLNPTYLSRLFKSVTNANLSDYILKIRMDKAQDLLNRSGMKINDIAMEVGYNSAPSFTRVFRKYCGKTPREYREE
ncbi:MULTISPECIES: helix-turn-helix domain-containing protein [unclassified Oceanispirochaeta]|uniref:helix-turn-helix domain-containing protein n=1 Tax=unclassified Oceanispirochaeta TaxID=2635722 RepID=UPI000E09950C|nr:MULTISPECIES: helix-turn-helix domain-containing protein [unclassified Oceanispirochaeta]MBF9018919.1 helix-turn-helix domain-containing protein [Oceanispirochaeta sp. M2]NPD75418.1 helix-turn-helix domain-containing protein [Oceanispirochaeta sp. M1]RDG28730.1 helix-turn-helix domain-containing protein [Oceanispirochaeta sp. M1]